MFTKDIVLADGLVLIQIKKPPLIAEMNAQLVLEWNILRIVTPKPVHATQYARMIIITTIIMHIALLHKASFENLIVCWRV